MENLFTEEVITQFFEVLKTTAEVGGSAFILWLCIPVLLALITAVAWCTGVVWIVRLVRDVIIHHSDNKTVHESERIALRQTEAEAKIKKAQHDHEEAMQPKEEINIYEFRGVKMIDDAAKNAARDFLIDIRENQSGCIKSYLHKSDIEKAHSVWLTHKGEGK